MIKAIKLGEKLAHPKCYEEWLALVKEHTKVVELNPEEVEITEFWATRKLCGICKESLIKKPYKKRDFRTER